MEDPNEEELIEMLDLDAEQFDAYVSTQVEGENWHSMFDIIFFGLWLQSFNCIYIQIASTESIPL